MILVTGSTGFIGSQLCRALAAQGERVRAFHRPTSSTAMLDGLDIEHATGDITQPETLRAAMQGVEVVFHTAAQLGSPRVPAQMYAVTVGGTRNVLETARQAGVQRVVHTSSVAALGVPDRPQRGSAPLPMDEHHTWNYRPEWWRYGHSKYLAELKVQRAVALGLDAVIVNPAAVLGAGDLNRVSGDMVVYIARHGVPAVVEGGVNVVHIADVVAGHLAALERGRTGERYILGGENMVVPELLNLIAEVTEARQSHLRIPTWLALALVGPVATLYRWGKLPVGGELLRQAGRYFYYDTRKAREELGLATPPPVREAIEDAYRWYLNQGMI